jgi:hypothetical protein
VEELCNAAKVLVEAVTGDGSAPVRRASISWADGFLHSAQDVDGLRDALAKGSLDEVLAVRLEVESADGEVSAVLMAREKLPGVTVEVAGADSSRVLGTAELVFQQIMIGYVDRMGGLRAPAWMLLALAPLLLLGIGLAPGRANIAARLLLILIAAIGSAAAFVLSYPRLLISQPIELLTRLPDHRSQQVRKGVLVFFRHPYTRRGLAVLGALIIGAAGSKLAQFLPFP